MTALFAYPQKAHFGRIVAKNKIYERAKPSTKVQNLFVQQVGRIVWRYKLAPETVNLPARPSVQEIEVFELNLKTPEVDEKVLRCIDKTVVHPIIFHLTHGDTTKVMASYKRKSDADSSKWVVGETYFESDWLKKGEQPHPLPVVLDLAKLYEHILRSIIGVPARDGESLQQHMARMENILAKQREYTKLETRLGKEQQFNRKVELNAQLRSLDQEIQNLKAGQ